MSRYVNDVTTDYGPEELAGKIAGFMELEGFELVDYKGRETWKKGRGFMVSPQYIQLESDGGKVHIEAWPKFALLPGVYIGSEVGTEGVVFAVPKRLLKGHLERLEQVITGG